MTPKKLPYQKFLESFKFAPRPAVNLLIEQNVKFAKLNSRVVLLTKRKKPPFAGYWHLPGSWVMKHEPLADCIKRVAREELGAEVENIELAGNFDDIDADPRGHAIDLVYRCRIKSGKIKPVGDSAEIRFFKKLPAKIGFNHKETLLKLGYR